ncbi:MAG: MFS transporter, partial [Sedimenticola sp.]
LGVLPGVAITHKIDLRGSWPAQRIMCVSAADKAGEFFGFYNMLGKFAAVVGPMLMGGVSLLSGSPRLSILSVALLFIAGLLVLLQVDEAEGQRQAVKLGEL